MESEYTAGFTISHGSCINELSKITLLLAHSIGGVDNSVGIVVSEVLLVEL